MQKLLCLVMCVTETFMKSGPSLDPVWPIHPSITLVCNHPESVIKNPYTVISFEPTMQSKYFLLDSIALFVETFGQNVNFLTLTAEVWERFKYSEIKAVALLLADPPRWDYATRQNSPICNLPLNIAVTFKPIMTIKNAVLFGMSSLLNFYIKLKKNYNSKLAMLRCVALTFKHFMKANLTICFL